MQYQPNPVHRNRTPGKSQWTITMQEEHNSFAQSVRHGWIEATSAWGLHTPNGQPLKLGLTQDHSNSVYIAKFVGLPLGPCHGYPADHTRCMRDIPSERILRSWLQNSLLTAPKARKILKGMKCNL